MEYGLIQTMTADQVTQMELDKQKSQETSISPQLASSLAQQNLKKWADAKEAKIIPEMEMLASVRQRRGEYDPQKLAEIKKVEMPEIFMNVTDTKVRNGIAWIKDIVIQPTMRIFSVDPTTLPDLPTEIKDHITREIVNQYLNAAVSQAQQTGQPVTSEQLRSWIAQESEDVHGRIHAEIVKRAKEMAEDIADQIDDHFIQGGFYKALDDCIDDIVGLKAGFIKGPIFRKENIKKTSIDPQTGRITRSVETKIVPQYDRRSPFSIFPSPRSTDIDNGYLFDVITIRPHDLYDLIGVPGYNDKEIREVLREFHSGRLNDQWLTLSEESKEGIGEQNKDIPYSPAENIYCLELYDDIAGDDLLEWGMSEKDIPDPDDNYAVCIWQIGNHIIKTMRSYDSLGRKPYSKISFENDNDSFWGRGVAEMIADCQQVCNACARAILANIGIACLTGDSVVYREGQDSKYSKVTIGELFNKKSQKHNGLHRIKLRSLNTDTGEFFGNKIVDVYDNGVADVYEVTTEHGYKIKATGTHKFMNDVGEWQELDNFDIGELIAVNGQVLPMAATCIDCGAETKGKGVRCKPCALSIIHRNNTIYQPSDFICPDCGVEIKKPKSRCHSCASKAGNNSWNKKQIEQSRNNYSSNNTTARMRYDCQSKKKTFCENCDGNNDLEQHHIDRVPWNNKEENLKTLCSGCHHKLHAKEDSFGDPWLHKYLSYDVITSIEYIGQEQVYNLQMAAPYHNFVVNGYVSKNSGPMVDLNVDRLEPGASRKIWPWRVFPTTDEQMASGSKAVNFFQPQMVTEQLIRVYDTFSKIADEHSGIPAYAHGDASVGGAGSTSSGLSQLIGMATRGIKAVVRNIDLDGIVPCLQRHYDYLLDNFEIYGLMGDYQLNAKGTAALVAREQQIVRKNEFLNYTNNPTDVQIIGVANRRKMLFSVAKDLGIELDESEVFPPQPMNMMQPQNMPPQATPATLGPDGAPTQGVDGRMASPDRVRLPVSTTGNAGGAEGYQ